MQPAPGKPLAWLEGEVKTPPFWSKARREAGALLRKVQRGQSLGMPHSRPMPAIGPGCHEPRVRDAQKNWRIVCRADPDAVLIVAVFAKATEATPKPVITACRRRLAAHDRP